MGPTAAEGIGELWSGTMASMLLVSNPIINVNRYRWYCPVDCKLQLIVGLPVLVCDV